MKLVTNFTITKATSVIYPDYTDEGVLQSVVMENVELISVEGKPTDVIDQNTRYHGSSLQGACEGSRVILGGKYSMLPIIVNEKLNLFYFPTTSPQRKDCVWFALHRIRSYHRFGKRTFVLFENNATFIANITYESFDSKYERACKLKNWTDRRTELLMVCEQPQSATYLISIDTSDRNYSVKRD